jgi:hypothetical protein
MMDDSEQLDSELNWRDPDPEFDRRFFKTRPPGANVMLAIASVAFLGCLEIYLQITGGVSAEHGILPVIGFFVFCAVAVIVSLVAGRWIWVRLGSPLRTMLRPFGRLGVTPAIAIVALGAVMLLGLLEAAGKSLASGKSVAETLRGGPLEGADFVVRSDGASRLVQSNLEEASAFCRAKGPGWRLPRTGDEAFLTERLTLKDLRRTQVIATEPRPGDSDGPFMWSDTANRFQRTLPFAPGGNGRPPSRFAVVCVKR